MTNNLQFNRNIDSLDSLVFEPFELNESDEFNDIDPDADFFNSQITHENNTCKYYNSEQLNTEINSKPHPTFSNLCFNIRSLTKNHRQLCTLLDSLDTKFHTISLTETWLKDHNSDLYELEGYVHEFQNRINKEGG